MSPSVKAFCLWPWVAQPNGAPLGLTLQKQFQERISAGSRAAATSQSETNNSDAKAQGVKEASKRVNLYAGLNPKAVYRAERRKIEQ